MFRIADWHRARFNHLTIALVALLLGACAGQQKNPLPVPVPGTGGHSVEQLQSFTIAGKLGVRSPTDNGSANINWEQQAAANYRIHLSGPLGAGATIITGNSGGVSLKRGSEPPMRAANPAQLTQQMLGWPLPVREMFYWVRGLPAPGGTAGEKRNSAGQLQALQQAGWQLEFSDYQRVGRYTLPTRIKARTNQAAGPVKVTLVIKEWQT
ncbi:MULTISPECIES: lipoprotein insertase outer membrane protein LolB [Microbulbifer]|uniref:lipoprotein insertase outer membrane protein LolB n=1 Tax=Microbulbifer TaxID=48073 RepID=UPI001E48BE1C|nr:MULTISPECIES: lipoprotein insertase outer membrane protein LolB [Microbulbifer]UHQ56392.1 lipoprotein insertase outer membrane protein LolB [Microbulbifer sp. YPW16]